MKVAVHTMAISFYRVCNARCVRLVRNVVITAMICLVIYTLQSLGGQASSNQEGRALPAKTDGHNPIRKNQMEDSVSKHLNKKQQRRGERGRLERQGEGPDEPRNFGINVDSNQEGPILCNACGETEESSSNRLTKETISRAFQIITSNGTVAVIARNTSDTIHPKPVTYNASRGDSPQMKTGVSVQSNPVADSRLNGSHERETFVVNVTRVQEEQKQRRSALERTCKSPSILKNHNSLYRETFAHVFVLDNQKLLFCYVPKVGCSNWKRILMVLAGRKRDMSSIDSREAHSRNRLIRLSSLSQSQQLERILSYRKVMFVREPLTRIVSAYKNKYRDLSVFRLAPENLQNFAKHIMRKHRPNATADELATGENITWSEFTDYLVDPAERPRFDEHWREMYKLCSPCQIRYDFVGRLENIEEEANYVLQQFNFTRRLAYPSSANSHPTNSASSNISDYFETFSRTKIQALWNIYKTDYALFGYEKPPFIQ